MSEATTLTEQSSKSQERKQRSTIIWVVALAMTGLVFDGYDLVVYGACVSTFLRDSTQLGVVTPATAGALGSYALFGVLVGALLAGSVGDILGRRKVLLFAYGWFSAGMALTAMTNSVEAFGAMRFITGLGVGALLATTAALVSEYSPKGKKNLMTAIVYSGIMIGSLLASLLAILLLEHIGWRGLFMIGALPFVTLLPIAMFKMPESVQWLAARGRMEEAKALSARTGFPLPDPEIQAQAEAEKKNAVGYSGLFKTYPFATLILGFMSATGLMLVYSLNTWLPELMLRAGFNAKGSLAFLLVLNGGAVIGALMGSRVADRFGPKMVVGACFGIGALAIAALTFSLPLAVLLTIVAIVGLGTSGTQTLIYGLVANYYRTNVRGAGVAWCAGFGRIGGVGGPMLGGFLVGSGFALDTIFFVLAGLAVFGACLTMLVPMSKSIEDIKPVVINPSQPGYVDPNSLYKNILVALDASKAEKHSYTLQRIKRLGLMSKGSVRVMYIQQGHVVSQSILTGAGLGVRTAQDDAKPIQTSVVQDVVNELSAAGIDAQAEVISAAGYDVAQVILKRAEELRADLLILETEFHMDSGHGFGSSVADQVIRHHPPLSILLAKPPV